MRVPGIVARAQAVLGTAGLLGLAIVACTVVVWGVVLYLVSTPGHRFSHVFRVLLASDLGYLPWFVTAVVLAAVVASRCAYLAVLVERLGARPWRVALLVLPLLAAGALWIYQDHTLSMDEYAVRFQSMAFAAGELTGRLPVAWLDRLVAPWFQNHFLFVSRSTGEVVSAYWPGFAMVMAPFAWADAAWLCNPVLAAVSVAMLAITARRVMPELPAAPGWAMAFAVASSAFLVMGISYYAMTAIMLANLAYILGFMPARPSTLFWSGVVGSLALTLHNPLPHVLFALPWMIWLVRDRGIGRDVLALLAGYLPLSLLLGIGWMVLRSRVAGATAVPAQDAGTLVALLDMAGKAFTLPDWGVVAMRVAGLAKLWIWAMPGLLLLALLGWWHGRRERDISLLAQSALLTFAGFLFVPFDQGHGWGYRYFHTAWFVLPLLAARYVAEPRPAQEEASRSPGPFAAALVVLGLLLVVPSHLSNVRSFIATLKGQIPLAGRDGALRVTFVYPDRGFYAQDLVQNDPFLRGGDIRMVGGDPEDDARFVLSISPDARMVARTANGVMWQLPEASIVPTLRKGGPQAPPPSR